MAVEFMMEYRNNNFAAKMEENAVQEAASGLESVEKLIRLLSQSQQQQEQEQQQQQQYQSSMEMERDCKAVADVAVSKFKKVISLLGRTRTGHARFRRAPLAPPAVNQSQERLASEPRVYHATPIQQIPPLSHHHHNQYHGESFIPKNGMNIDRKDSSTTTINFSYSSAATSFMSSLTGDTDSKQPSSSSAFQITNLSQVSSVGKPPLSSLKRKCSLENLGSGKCGGSSGRCHCSKKRFVTWVSYSVFLFFWVFDFDFDFKILSGCSRKLRVKRVVRVPAISLKMADIPPDDYSWRKYGQKPIKGSPHPRYEILDLCFSNFQVKVI
jgi:hypothetical protein